MYLLTRDSMYARRICTRTWRVESWTADIALAFAFHSREIATRFADAGRVVAIGGKS